MKLHSLNAFSILVVKFLMLQRDTKEAIHFVRHAVCCESRQGKLSAGNFIYAGVLHEACRQDNCDTLRGDVSNSAVTDWIMMHGNYVAGNSRGNLLS
jgi:hypothetical protein